MKRSALAPLVVLVACGSGPDPATTEPDLTSVLVTNIARGGYVGSVALDGQGQVYVTAEEAVSVLRFDQSVAAPSPWGGPSAQSEIEVAAAGSSLHWAASEGPTASLWTVPAAAFSTASPSKTSFGGIGDVVGLVADSTAVYAALAPAPAGPSPDSWQWPQSTSGDAAVTGRIFRIVPGASGSVDELTPAAAISLFPGMMEHVLAQNAMDLFWVDSAQVGPEAGRVMAAAKTGWNGTEPRRVGGATIIPGLGIGFVGLAATDAYVAWTVAAAPDPGAVGCWVWATTVAGNPKLLFDTDQSASPFLCNGLAIDGTYAYFAVVETYVPPSGPGDTQLLGKALARIPLAGGKMQTLPLTADRWYGARRLLVDDTYVYAVDPSYVVRFPKTAFGP
jgi:hypothetical protein